MKPASLLAALALLIAVPSSGLAQAAKTAKAKKNGESSATCNADLWNFVYNPQRLPAKTDCRTLTGTIKNFVVEPDGDFHIRFIVDDTSLVNEKNNSEEGGALVVEPICQNTPTQADAIQPCKGYNGPKFAMSQFCPGAPNRPSAPKGVKEGEGKTHTCKNPPRVQITGFYTIDNDHGWMELHTVSNIAPASAGSN